MVGLEERVEDRIGSTARECSSEFVSPGLISSPELVILDEPSIGLDPVGMVEVRNMVKGHCQVTDNPILLVASPGSSATDLRSRYRGPSGGHAVFLTDGRASYLINQATGC